MKLTNVELDLMNYIWKLEPIGSGELVKLCNEKFDWKKSTTYTYLKRMQERGLIINENTYVSSLIKKSAFQKSECQSIIDTIYDGSLFCFIETYLENHQVSSKEKDSIISLLDSKKKIEKKFIHFEV